MKVRKSICFVLCAAMLLCGCSAASENTVATAYPVDTTQSTQNTEATAQSISLPEEVFSSRDMDASYEEDCIPVVLEGNTISCDSAAVEVSGSTATIRKEGVYLILSLIHI